MPQLITRRELEDLCEKGLQAKLSALITDVVRTQRPYERTLEHASIGTVSTALHRERAKRRVVAPNFWI
jgi:hypothetical protein